MYVCVCGKKGEPSCSTGARGGGAGFSFLPGPHAQLENHKTAGVGGWGKGMPQKQRDILFHRGGAGRIHHDVHYLLKYKST